MTTRTIRRSAAAMLAGFLAGVGIGYYALPDETDVVVSQDFRDLDTAVREDLGMDGTAEWEAYGARVRANVGGLLASGADPATIELHDDGTTWMVAPPRPEYGRALPATTPPADYSSSPTWGCSPGLPVTVAGYGVAEAVWLTAAHCTMTHAHDTTVPWEGVFGGNGDVAAAGSAIATGGTDTGVDYAPDYGLTRRSTLPMEAVDMPIYTATLPPVMGMKVCASTIHGWRCGVINEFPHPGVVASSTYATPGDSGSIAGVGGAAVYVTAWARGLEGQPGTAMGYSVSHIADHAAANGWSLAVGWAH